MSEELNQSHPTKYTVYWAHGKRSVEEATGNETFAEMMLRKGFKRSVVHAISLVTPGDDHRYKWNGKDWVL